jgi:hypothetical protein
VAGIGYPAAMTDSNVNQTDDNTELRHDAAPDEAVQAVVDRVLSWQAGAPEETVRTELRKGLEEVGASMPDSWVAETAERISHADPAQQG